MRAPYSYAVLPLDTPDDDPIWTSYVNIFRTVFLDSRAADEGVATFRAHRREDGAVLGMVTTEGPGLDGRQPVAAFNYGARKFRRVQKAAVFTIGAAFCMLVVLVSLCWVNSDALIRLFRDDPEVTAVALPAFHYQCLAILLQPVIVVANMTFQSVGKAGRATFLACCRQGVFFIPLILILPRTLGLVGVETCQPIADALTFIVSLPFLLAFLKQLDRMDDAEKAKAQS